MRCTLCAALCLGVPLAVTIIGCEPMVYEPGLGYVTAAESERHQAEIRQRQADLDAARTDRFSRYLAAADSLEAFADVAKQYPDAAWRELINVGRREWYCESHPDLGKAVRDTIIQGHVAITMTCEQVRASWGEPHRINRSGSAYGLHEQWIYEWRHKTVYLYFEDGIMRSWQES